MLKRKSKKISAINLAAILHKILYKIFALEAIKKIILKFLTRKPLPLGVGWFLLKAAAKNCSFRRGVWHAPYENSYLTAGSEDIWLHPTRNGSPIGRRHNRRDLKSRWQAWPSKLLSGRAHIELAQQPLRIKGHLPPHLYDLPLRSFKSNSN